MKKIHLQGTGKVKAIMSQDLKIGDITIWNYGYKEKVIGIEETKSRKSLKVKILDVDSNKTLTRTLRKGTIVGISI